MSAAVFDILLKGNERRALVFSADALAAALPRLPALRGSPPLGRPFPFGPSAMLVRDVIWKSLLSP
jgi:hypothetical protein